MNPDADASRLAEALEAVVARTGHEHFRRLCSEGNPDPAEREGCRRLVLELAGMPPPRVPPPPDEPTPVPLAESLDLLKKINACPHRSRDDGCSCAGMRCALGKGKAGLVNFHDCSACVKGES